MAAAAQQLVDIAFARVIEGEYIPVFDRDGCRIGGKRRYSERMMMFLMRAYLPDRFRHAHESLRQPSEPPAPALPSVPEALVALTPEVPAEPHRLMAPDRLDDASQARSGSRACTNFTRAMIENGTDIPSTNRMTCARRHAALRGSAGRWGFRPRMTLRGRRKHDVACNRRFGCFLVTFRAFARAPKLPD